MAENLLIHAAVAISCLLYAGENSGGLAHEVPAWPSQKDMFLYTLAGDMLPYCYWCQKQIGEGIPITSRAQFDEYQSVINAAFRKMPRRDSDEVHRLR